MKLAVLTTETTHHAHFVRAVNDAFEIALIVCETQVSPAPFPTSHAFEVRRDEHERRLFFDGRDVRLADTAELLEVPTANEPAAIDALRGVGPDVIVVFGTGKLARDVIDLCPRRIVNLHGGDPEYYRGLDTHLWAIYHREFDQLVTTLHRLSGDLDAGDIIAQAALPLAPGMGLHELRAQNTQACVDLTLSGLAALERTDDFPHRPQRQAGRYYSHMPTVLKEVCVRHFEAHTRGVTL